MSRTVGTITGETGNVFSRESRITIRNNSNYTLIRKTINIKSGRFRRDIYGKKELPAEKISLGEITTFVVNNVGVLYFKGPEGTVTYTMVDNTLESLGEVIIYWSNPIDTNRIMYSGVSIPEKKVRFSIYPPVSNISGWRHNVEIIII